MFLFFGGEGSLDDGWLCGWELGGGSMLRLCFWLTHAPQEEVVGLRGVAAVLEEAQQVVVLPVQVPADLDGRLIGVISYWGGLVWGWDV